MKNKLKICYIVGFMTVCALPLIAVPFVNNNVTIGNTENASKPNIVKNGKLNTDFSHDFESWYSDHLSFRSQTVTASAYVSSTLFNTGSANVTVGKEGSLFLTEELEIYSGITKMTERQIYATAEYLSLLQEYCKDNGKKFLFTAVPDKCTVYSQYVPSYFLKCDDKSDMEKLYDVMNKKKVDNLDLTSTLTENSDSYDYYFKTDTHWNNLGAFTAWCKIMGKLGASINDYSGIKYKQSEKWTGDLAKMLYPYNPTTEYQYDLNLPISNSLRITKPAVISGKSDTASKVSDLMGDSEKHDTMIDSINTSGKNGTITVRRDSFGRALLPLFMDNYKKTYFTRADAVTQGDLSKGSTFVYEIVERNLKNIAAYESFLPSPKRENVKAESYKLYETDSCKVNADYAMLKISGKLDDRHFAKNSDAKIYVVVSGNGSDKAFEAYPILNSSGQGYSAYIDTTDLQDGDYNVSLQIDSESTGIVNKFRQDSTKQ